MKTRAGEDGKGRELEELKDKVPCAAVLEREGFALDVKESTAKEIPGCSIRESCRWRLRI